MKADGRLIAVIAVLIVAVAAVVLFIGPCGDQNPEEKEANSVSATQLEGYFNGTYEHGPEESLHLDGNSADVYRHHTVWNCGSDHYYTVTGTGTLDHDDKEDVEYYCVIGKMDGEWTIAKASLHLFGSGKDIGLIDDPHLMMGIGAAKALS